MPFFLQSSCLGGCLSCRVDQVAIGTKAHSICETCMNCPKGSEPSIPCGGVGEVYKCQPCAPGTFSTEVNKDECHHCKVCGPGGIVQKNCTSQSNTVCGPCRRGFYLEPFVQNCLPCSACCNDGKDVYSSDCKNSRMQCKKRRDSCAVTQVTTNVLHTSQGITTPESPRAKHSVIPSQELQEGQEVHKTKDKSKENSESGAADMTWIAVVAVAVVVSGTVVLIGYKRKYILSRLLSQPPRSNDLEPGTDIHIAPGGWYSYCCWCYCCCCCCCCCCCSCCCCCCLDLKSVCLFVFFSP